ncbi:alpha/beta hydrolase [Pararhizobium mangrovi]|uniref:Alpha/beta hydrolase n=1 Tax=Pararhizobium mangrovi TaxID=2590452 RepID=A0A506TXF1_9HYPH|nr:alpha/beta hydrolase [Pararhizobium mangrovi]
MSSFLLGICALAAVVALFTAVQTRRIEARFPPLGARFDVGGFALHAVHVTRPETADLPALVFIHGASGNLRDQMQAFRKPLEGRAEMVFVDRPGHGYSDRGGPGNDRPDGQARAIATLLERLGIERAIIVGHSLGSAIAVNFALVAPEKTLGLVFLAPATHPWPGGVAWYNTLAARPIAGRLFAHLVAMPAGLSRVKAGTACVFQPNEMPDSYAETGAALVLRPSAFRSNARDLAFLHAHIVETAPCYPTITAPTTIVTGDRDGVVLPDLHSRGLARDIAGSRLVWLEGVGHKPDYAATDVAISAIEEVAKRAIPAPADANSEEAAAAKRSQIPVSPSEPI